jgi:hypothetical protein
MSNGTVQNPLWNALIHTSANSSDPDDMKFGDVVSYPWRQLDLPRKIDSMKLP